MNTLMPFVVAGLATGSVYAIAALGLVLTYKTSGVFNFGHGAIGTVAAYGFYELHVQRRWPWPVAVVACLLAVGGLGGLALERLARRLSEVELASRVVATLGIFLAVQGTAVVLYGSATRDVPQFLPTTTFSVLGVHVGYNQLIVFVLGLATAAGLSLFFKRSRVGIAMRGVVDDPSLLALSATSPVKVRRYAWVIGSTFAAGSGILLVPLLGLDAALLTLLVVQAFGGAALGAFSSLPGTYLGSLAVGVAAAISKKYVVSVPSLAGLPSSIPFIALFVALLVIPKRKLVDLHMPQARTFRARPPAILRTRVIGYSALGIALAIVPQVVGSKIPVYTNGLIFVIVFLSLQLLVRTSGQVSLCHAAFAAVGASTFAHASHGLGLPWLASLFVAGAVAIPIGAIVAVPAIRLSGVYLAVATFGFGILVESIFYGTALMFGSVGSRTAPRPMLFGLDMTTDTGFYYAVLAVVVAACALTLVVQGTRLGRLLRALAGSPIALETYGASVNLTRVLAFCISAFMAGVAGGLFASLSGSVSGAGFRSFQSLTWLAVLMIVGSAPILSSVVAGVVIAVVPAYLNGSTAEYLPILFGVSALLAARPSGGHGWTSAVLESLRRAGDRTARSPVRARHRAVVPQGEPV